MTADARTRPEERLAGLVLARPARLRHGRLVCVDGPAGSGKTTLADGLAEVLRRRGVGVAVVHLDDVYEGWEGLPAVGARLHAGVVGPLAEGRAGSYRRYDWHAGRYAETRVVPPADVVLLEGVGAGHPAYAAHVSLLVWVEAPDDVRLARGLRRDGAAMEARWREWMRSEEALHRREDTRRRADVVVDGTTGRLSVRDAG